MISERLKIAIRKHPVANYKIARAAGLHPSTMSLILTGARPVKDNDPRVIKIGSIVGLELEECFEKAPENNK